MLALSDVARAALIGIDIQERLLGAVPESGRAPLLRNVGVLLQAARALLVPTFVTEQYPAGLGLTHPDLRPLLHKDLARFEKTVFSCCAVAPFMQALQRSDRRQAILMGLEAHVCVLQTASGLLDRGYQVFVVEDAVASRTEANRANGLARLRASGVIVTNTESVLFEWLRDAGHPAFKRLSALIK